MKTLFFIYTIWGVMFFALNSSFVHAMPLYEGEQRESSLVSQNSEEIIVDDSDVHALIVVSVVNH